MKIFLSSAILAAVAAPVSSFSYLENLGGNVASAPSGRGIGSYLDTVATNPSVSGPGIGAYTDNVGGSSAAAAPAAAAPAPVAPAPVAAAPASVGSDSSPAGSSSSYLSHLNTGSAALGGAGIETYLASVKTNAASSGGAGIQSYLSTVKTNAPSSGGAGIPSYTNNLGGGSTPSGKNFSPFGGAKPAAASFSGSVGGTDIGFTLEASDLSELVQGMSGGGTIRLSGSITGVSFN
ncbi:MAG: hypothetical protein SGILL_004463 [Bacillariaceae sp.]